MYLRVFIMGGLLCVSFQLLKMFFGTVPPPKINVLGFAIGGILTPFSLYEALSGWGDWGIGVTVVSGGNACAKAFYQLMRGNILPLLETLGLYAAIFIIGALAGIIREQIENRKSNKNRIKTR